MLVSNKNGRTLLIQSLTNGQSAPVMRDGNRAAMPVDFPAFAWSTRLLGQFHYLANPTAFMTEPRPASLSAIQVANSASGFQTKPKPRPFMNS